MPCAPGGGGAKRWHLLVRRFLSARYGDWSMLRRMEHKVEGRILSSGAARARALLPRESLSEEELGGPSTILSRCISR